MQMLAKLPARRWWYLMPVIFITYSLAYLDRANYGFAAAAGIESDLGITKGTASLIGALFFWAISFSGSRCDVCRKTQRAKNDFLQPDIMGLLRGGHRVCQQYSDADGDSLYPWVVEAAVMPAMLIYISNWFTKPSVHAPIPS
jgi:hypothetical protein